MAHPSTVWLRVRSGQTYILLAHIFRRGGFRNIQKKLLPTSILVSQEENDFINNLPISIGRNNDKQTKIYICKNYVCDLPIDNIDDLKLKL